MLQQILCQRNLSCYWLAKQCSLPYSTVSDICNNKTPLNKCRAEIVYKIAHALNLSMDELMEPYMIKRIDFELYKSNVCHAVKELGDIAFILQVLKSNDIQQYYNWEWYPECFYLLAMTDYLSRVNDIPLCDRYNELRCCKLQHTVYPASILALAAVNDDAQIKEQSIKTSIPEFIRYNIVEKEIRNVI